ncbi:MAG: ABC transporter permease [Gemmataceae bacterium]|jgi:ABC-type transport system involved in multi-copper enzyme maturation permease subunit
MSSSFQQWLIESSFVWAQFLLSIPWVFTLFFSENSSNPKAITSNKKSLLTTLGIMLLVGAVSPPVFHTFLQETNSIETAGRVYGAIFQTQLILDAFVMIFLVLLKVWPKGGAVAQAAFREGIRQPMFWLLSSLALFALLVSPFIPYFTFGEDLIMVKELGYDTIMLAAVVFGTLASSISVSEEIEGRTAVTLMSKPISRRQFLLGKFAGILLSSFLMSSILFVVFQSILLYKHWLDRMDPVPNPEWIKNFLSGSNFPSETKDLINGLAFWVQHTLDTFPGLILSFCQVSVLVSISVSLATRLPMVVNLSTILVIYFLAHLTPVLVAIGEKSKLTDPDSPVSRLLGFMAGVFDLFLPGLEFFRVGPAIVGESPPDFVPFAIYVLSVSFYGLIYTAVALLIGLILFEDRDLA